ncbi:MAG TPA: hypothetical protein VFN36_03665 [Solirubrobacteraceae bacterium]|nr:hypothetical protein [Solirubrobacteraceae bacterium]
MFTFRRNNNELDTSLFDPEQDMDLVAMINEARTESEILSVARMSRARMRARRRQLEWARRPHQADATRARGFAPPHSSLRGL